MPEAKELFYPDAFYHIYNKAVGDDVLFKSKANYSYFLSLLKEKLEGFVKFYSYCLMPNHFHLLIQIKNHKQELRISEESNSDEIVSRVISRQFGNLFNAYAQVFNKENNRKGGLFKNRFQRKRINNEKYLVRLVQYIHMNPVETGLCSEAFEWGFSSYNALSSSNKTLLEKDEVIAWFENIDNFKFMHHIS